MPAEKQELFIFFLQNPNMVESYMSAQSPCEISMEWYDVMLPWFPNWKSNGISLTLHGTGLVHYENHFNDIPFTDIKMDRHGSSISIDLGTGVEEHIYINNTNLQVVPYFVAKHMLQNLYVESYTQSMWMNLTGTPQNHDEQNWKSLLKGILNYDFWFNAMLDDYVKLANNFNDSVCGETLWENMNKIGIEIKSEFMKSAIYKSIEPIFPTSWAVILESERVSVDGIISEMCHIAANNTIHYLNSMKMDLSELRTMAMPIVAEVYQTVMAGLNPTYANIEGPKALAAQTIIKNVATCDVATAFYDYLHTVPDSVKNDLVNCP